VKQVATTLDEYIYTADDQVAEGDIEAGRVYEEKDLNTVIEMRKREAEHGPELSVRIRP
jgi:type I restriction enzyme R subunit